MGKFLIRVFIKDFKNVTDVSVRQEYGKLSGIVGIITNALLCAAKIGMGVLTGSIAVIADGINNLTDAGSSVITLVGFKLSGMPEDKEHPYGHARMEYLTGLLVSVVIILLGVQLASASFKKILHPDPLQFSYITVLILILAILVKLWQSRFYIYAGTAINSVALIASGTDSRNDVLSTSAVLVSLLIGKITGLQTDGYCGCLVAVFIVWSGVQLVQQTSSPLLGESPDPKLVASIAQNAQSYSGVLGIHDLVVHNYGPGKIFASVHIEVDADGDLMESHDMIDIIERTLSSELAIHLVVHMDPVRINDPLVEKLHGLIEEIITPMPDVQGMHDLRIVPGTTHTNIIFDLVLSSDCKATESDIENLIEKEVKKLDLSYFVVITFDRSYNEM